MGQWLLLLAALTLALGRMQRGFPVPGHESGYFGSRTSSHRGSPHTKRRLITSTGIGSDEAVLRRPGSSILLRQEGTPLRSLAKAAVDFVNERRKLQHAAPLNLVAYTNPTMRVVDGISFSLCVSAKYGSPHRLGVHTGTLHFQADVVKQWVGGDVAVTVTGIFPPSIFSADHKPETYACEPPRSFPDPQEAGSVLLETEARQRAAMYMPPDAPDLPDEYDLRDAFPRCRHVIERVRRQGSYCGSCYAIASLDVMRDRSCIDWHMNGEGPYDDVDLSVEDVVYCGMETVGDICYEDTRIQTFGCDGGHAFKVLGMGVKQGFLVEDLGTHDAFIDTIEAQCSEDGSCIEYCRIYNPDEEPVTIHCDGFELEVPPEVSSITYKGAVFCVCPVSVQDGDFHHVSILENDQGGKELYGLGAAYQCRRPEGTPEEPGLSKMFIHDVVLFDGMNILGSEDATEERIKYAILNQGPVVATIQVYSSLFNHAFGIFTLPEIIFGEDEPLTEENMAFADENPNEAAYYVGTHTVAIVGWGVDAESGYKYWLLRNTWDDWGESGFFRVFVNDAHIGVEKNIAFAHVRPLSQPCSSTMPNIDDCARGCIHVHYDAAEKQCLVHNSCQGTQILTDIAVLPSLDTCNTAIFPSGSVDYSPSPRAIESKVEDCCLLNAFDIV